MRESNELHVLVRLRDETRKGLEMLKPTDRKETAVKCPDCNCTKLTIVRLPIAGAKWLLMYRCKDCGIYGELDAFAVHEKEAGHV